MGTSTFHLKALHCSKGTCTEIIKSNMVTIKHTHVLRPCVIAQDHTSHEHVQNVCNLSMGAYKHVHLVPSHGQ